MDSVKVTLISQVFRHEPIWNSYNKNHHNKYVLNKAWEEIVKKMNQPGEKLKKMWKVLRQEFRKQLQKAQTNRSASEELLTTDWPYFKMMLFLRDQFIPRKPEDDLSSQETTVPGQNKEGEEFQIDSREECLICDDETQVPPPAAKELHSVPSTSSGYRKRPHPSEIIGRALLDIEKKMRRKEERMTWKRSDEDLGFFNSLMPHVKKLQPEKKLIFRMKVQELLHEFVYTHQQQQQASPAEGTEFKTTNSDEAL